ncbi:MULTISPECIES: ABC transporter substrate-binding protein [Rathayibacter]|uniref:ABC transporter substrate-binding protein n=1 Tax=Rathayibacter festucae DSM 15932 TaxID=1328866 RepID=A0A3T0T5A0_9MICO|nr:MULTISPECIES: extracellular solute-binding protein [Rathayibacter]AZZ53783.1 ABC transporter substrate-binding protein [Rathayibacter festucae DSM 15932]MCJ1698686.1 extracellular solute-binding protein [Rathayibacter festucae]ROQ05723.1 lactose/L-arabinose transport system substrate-binding protein [Rathayibacter sp. PhB93]TDQ06745.1 lactose/L-arabinose transport system substrate-binding protein [Rathayibacter sp. PhB1]
MRRSSKKFTTVVAVSLPLVLALSACAAGGGGGGGNAAGGGDGDETLSVWAWDPVFNIAALEEAEKIYQEDHPDFKLDIIETPWDDLQPKLTTLAQSQQYEELPDVFLMQNNAFQKNLVNYPEIFSELPADAVDFAEFPEAVAAYSTLDDVHYGVPFDSGTAVTALRTDVLEAAGYTIDDFTDITWEEFLTKGKDVLAKTGSPLLSGQAGSSDMIMMMLQSAGASLFDDEGNPTITDNDALLAAIDVYKQLVDSGVFVEVNSWDEYLGTFVNGSVGGTIQGIWIVGSIQTAEDQAGDWAITNVPSLDGISGATNYTASGGSSWAISANADVDLAADFLASTFAGSTELYDTILPKSGAVANWLPAGSSTAYEQPNEFFAGQPIFAEVAEFGAEVPSNNTGAYYYEGRDAVSAAITQIIGGADPASALEEAQKNVEFAMS